MQVIGMELKSFGTCILKDDFGVIMGEIQADNRAKEDMMRDIFMKWFQGMMYKAVTVC